MVSARKRPLHEVDGNVAETSKEAPREPSMLHRLRNMWQFANLCQWLLIFGGAVKVDSIDVDDLEAQCLSAHSTALQDIGLALLKFLSSHRGLTPDLFDEYTKRQYASKAPQKPNPFGDDEVPAKFSDFDVFKKIRILQQMTQFIMMNPEKIRERMAELKDADHDHTSWRIEPYGWDRHDHTYYCLDDNRLYRMMEPPPAPAKPKKNSKKARAAARAKKRRRISAAQESDAEDAGDEAAGDEADAPAPEEEDDGLGGMKWECVAVTLDEVREFLATIQKTKDPNEKVLRDQIAAHLVPILETQEERRKKRQREREKELLNLEKLAHAKRSSRIASRAEHQKQEELAREAEKKRILEEEAAHKEEQKRLKREKERDNRLMSREKRLKEREARRLQHEEEIAQLSEDSNRMSERRRLAEIEKNKQALKELEEEEDWVFDCVCGLYGQVDDGEHSVSCESCNVWQHSKCLGIDEHEAEKDDFHFICSSCRRRQEETKEGLRRPAIKIKVKGSDPLSPDSTPRAEPGTQESESHEQPPTGGSSPPAGAPKVNGAPKSTALGPPRQELSVEIPVKVDGAASRGSGLGAGTAPKPTLNGTHNNPFSAPHPDLIPPDLSPNKSRAYGTIYDQSKPGQKGSHATLMVNGAPRRISTTPILPPVLPRTGNGISNSTTISGKAVPGSPSKPTLESTTKSTSSAVSIPQGASPTTASSQQVQGTPSSVAATPKLTPREVQDEFRYDQNSSSPLPPSRGGLSPTKHSPVLPQGQLANGIPSSSPAPPILPPVAALSPSPAQQNLTPPVKHAGVPKPPPPLSLAQSTAAEGAAS